MELDPKPDEYLIANPRAQPHAHSFPHRRRARTCSQDAVLCFKKASIFSVCDGPAFAELDYVVCFPDEILIRGLSPTKCCPALGKILHAVSRMGWVLARGKQAWCIPVLQEGEGPCWNAGGVNTPKAKEISEHGLSSKGFLLKSLSNSGQGSAVTGRE